MPTVLEYYMDQGLESKDLRTLMIRHFGQHTFHDRVMRFEHQ